MTSAALASLPVASPRFAALAPGFSESVRYSASIAFVPFLKAAVSSQSIFSALRAEIAGQVDCA